MLDVWIINGLVNLLIFLHSAGFNYAAWLCRKLQYTHSKRATGGEECVLVCNLACVPRVKDVYWAFSAPPHWLLTSRGEQLRGQKQTKAPPAVSICQRLTIHLLGARQTFCPPDCRTALLSVSPVWSHSWRDAGGDRDIFCSDTSWMSRSAVDSCRSLRSQDGSGSTCCEAGQPRDPHRCGRPGLLLHRDGRVIKKGPFIAPHPPKH